MPEKQPPSELLDKERVPTLTTTPITTTMTDDRAKLIAAALTGVLSNHYSAQKDRNRPLKELAADAVAIADQTLAMMNA